MLTRAIRILITSCLAAPLLFAGTADNTQDRVARLRANTVLNTLPNLAELQNAAQQGLAKMRLLVNPENHVELGFPDLADAAMADVGSPLREYLVRLDQLRSYKPGDDPEPLLTDIQVVEFPVVGDNETRCGISIGLVRDQWTLLSIGGPARMKLLVRAAADSGRALGRPQEEHFIVRIPALRVEFVGARDDEGKLNLAPVIENKAHDFRTGVPEPAGSVFERLVPAAQAHDGLPR